jgi:hypothetical protein
MPTKPAKEIQPEDKTEENVQIFVRNNDGHFLGYADSYGKAKRMQIAWLDEHRPNLVDDYAGISTSSGDTYGMPLFLKDG